MLNSLFSDAGRLWLIAGCAALSLCICLPMFLHYKKIRLELAACFKSLGTACAMIMALIASIKLDPRCWVCFAGLAVHSVADALLEYHFLIGMGTFICGHILYIAFFTGFFSFSAPVLICFLILAVLLILVLYRFRMPEKAFFPVPYMHRFSARWPPAGLAAGSPPIPYRAR